MARVIKNDDDAEPARKKSLPDREERHLAVLDTLGTAAVRAIELAVHSKTFHITFRLT